jgi:hypothetical protein
VFWLLTGTVLGVGVAALPSIGIFLLPAGLILLVVGMIWLRGRELWALPIGIGLLPALLIARTLLTLPPPCPSGELTIPPGQTSVSCSGPISALVYQLLAGFVLIAVLGAVGFVVAWVRAARRPAV